MIAFLIPFAVIVGVVMMSGRRTDAARVGSDVRMLSPGGAAAVSPAPRALPGPLATLCDYLRSGRRPPEFVVRCAVAEAELIGRRDLALDLVQTFGPQVPAGTQAQLAQTAAPQLPPQATPQAVVPTPAPAMQFAMPDAPDANAQGAPVVDATPLAPAPELASPLPGVSSGAWSEFAARLVREAPGYNSQRHVGRYRHNKARVAEIGFDPQTIVGSPDAQDAALAADMTDACKHVIASGLGSAVVGRPIAIPDLDEAPLVTLSGVLGVASVAGLDGAVEWLESKHDRKRFPHTTAAFMRTNGVF